MRTLSDLLSGGGWSQISSALVAPAVDILRNHLAGRGRFNLPVEPTTKQQEFLSLHCREALYGGAAGGGKTVALLAAALQHTDVPGYSALLLRRTYRDLALPGALMDLSHQWLSNTEARWNGMEYRWTFPSGATVSFGYLDTERDKYRYQPSEFQFIGFDELTQFPEGSYLYLFSRLRKRESMPVSLRMRAASNPGGEGHDWVRARFLVEAAPDQAFVPARLDDNPFLDKAAYVESLNQLDYITRQQLLMGDWDAIPSGGVLRSEWFQRCGWSNVPREMDEVIQAWDTAFKENSAADYSACLTLGRCGGSFFVMDVLRERMEWPRLLTAAKTQYERFRPRLVLIEERASGISLIQALVGEMMLPVLPVRAETSKLARTTSISSLIESGRLWVPEGFSWADAFLQECAMFPSGAHDDQVDALTHALRYFMLREGESVVLPYEVAVSISPDLDSIENGYL